MSTLARPRAWARAAVVFVTWLLPRGSQRDGYRRELEAELWLMTPREQWTRSVSMVRGARALRRSVLESRPQAHTLWWCRLHLHHEWRRAVTEDGGRYRHCVMCGADDDGTVNQMYGGWQGGNIPPTTGRG